MVIKVDDNVCSFVFGGLVGMALVVDECLEHKDGFFRQMDTFCNAPCPIKAAAGILIGATSSLMLNYFARMFDLPENEQIDAPQPRLSSNKISVEGAWEIEEEDAQ